MARKKSNKASAGAIAKPKRRKKVLPEQEKNRLALRAHKRFLVSGIEIKDVFGALD
jgi:hypothetical protein